MSSPTLVSQLWAALRDARPSNPQQSYAAAMSPSALLVLIAVAQIRQDNPGQTGAAIAQVAQYTGLAPSTVSTHLTGLARRSWVQRYGHRPVLWRIAMANG